jgi:predicted 2-oxoglutarate/Fe(II)-dependent dioxygenase YbiX
MVDRKAWAPDSRMAAVDPDQTQRNFLGRQRVVDGVLTPSEATAPITPADYDAQDFIIVPDFLTAKECDRLTTMFNQLHGLVKHRKVGIDFWEGRIVYMGEVADHDAAAAAIMGNFQKRATAMLGEFYALTSPLWTDTVQLNVWEQGSFLPCHTDNSNPNGTPHSSAWRDFSSIVYLNDDYEGGELYFTAQDRMLKPKQGMLVAFSAGYHHEHGVLKVTQGRRITMPAFYTFDKRRADPHIYPELYPLTAPPVPAPAAVPAPSPAAPSPLSILAPAAQSPVWQPPGKWRRPQG